MVSAVVLLADSLPDDTVREWQEVVANFASFSGKETLLAVGTVQGLCAVDALMERGPDRWEVVNTAVAPISGKAVPMSAAPFVYREDGRPDWRRCGLASASWRCTAGHRIAVRPRRWLPRSISRRTRVPPA